jgi:hypothetical protein
VAITNVLLEAAKANNYLLVSLLLKHGGRTSFLTTMYFAQERGLPLAAAKESLDREQRSLLNSWRTMRAAIWRKKRFLNGIEMYGIEHMYSRADCKRLGFCLAELGRYEDAIVLFQQTAEKVALSQTGDSDSRNEYIQDICGWISEVEKMGRGGSSSGDSTNP